MKGNGGRLVKAPRSESGPAGPTAASSETALSQLRVCGEEVVGRRPQSVAGRGCGDRVAPPARQLPGSTSPASHAAVSSSSVKRSYRIAACALAARPKGSAHTRLRPDRLAAYKPASAAAKAVS